MQITVQVSPSLARDLRQGETTPAATDLSAIADQAGVSLTPMHTDTNDPALQTYFLMEVPDRSTADQVQTQLLEIPGVEAAYIKPADEMP